MSEPVLGVGRSLSGRRWIWREAEDRVGLGIAQRLAVPEIVGRLLAARGVGVEAAQDYLEPTLRVLLPEPFRAARHGSGSRAHRGGSAAVRDRRGVRRLRCGRRVQQRADAHVVARAGLSGALPCAGPDGRRLRPERAGARLARRTRRHADRLRRLRHRGRSCVGGGASAGRRRGAGSPQGGRAAATHRGHGEPEPAGLRLRSLDALRGGGRVPHRRRGRCARCGDAVFSRAGRSPTCSVCSTWSRSRRSAT